MTLPGLYLVGAPKAGTTSVASWLAEHPAVFWSTPKEPYYWATDYPGMREHYGFDSRARYERLFSSSEALDATVRGEGSTTYLYSKAAVPAIVQEVPDATFVVCLRNPVDMIVSYHRTQLVALNEDEPDFGLAWRRSLLGGLPWTQPLDPKLVDYPLVGRLGDAMAELLQRVPRDRVHVIWFEDLVHAPDRTWDALTHFVGIGSNPRPAFEAKNPSEKAFRFGPVRRLTHRPPAALQSPMRRLRQWSRTTSMPGVAVAKRSLWRQAPRPRANPEIRREVAMHLRPDVERLSDLLDRDLGHWTALAAQVPRTVEW